MAGKAPFHVRMPMGPGGGYRPLHTQARQGMDAVVANFNRFCDWMALEVAPEAMQEAVEPVMELSDHYAPKDTHAMVNSRYNAITKSRGKVRCEVGYNRYGEAPYTILVHEMPHFYHEPPTQYKFLERAMDEETPELVGRLASIIKRNTGL